jgi:hypothetical protein
MDFYDELGNVVANLLKIAHSKYPKKLSRNAKDRGSQGWREAFSLFDYCPHPSRAMQIGEDM